MSYQRQALSGEEAKSVTFATGATVNQQAATWYVTDSDTGGSNSVATKAAGGAGTNHYICGIMANHLTIDDYAGETATVELKTGSTRIILTGIFGSASRSYYQGGDSLFISFAHPIKAGTNEAVTLTVDPENAGGTTHANVWGYTV